METTASFQASARHLFRHLDEPHVLRRNAIARRFLVDPETGRSSPAIERSGTSALRQLIAEAAEHARRADLEAGCEERAYRHFKIATRCLIERAHPSLVARELGISERQCYRDRSLVVERLARFVLESPAARPAPLASSFEPIDLQFQRAEQLSEMGCEDEAARRYGDIARSQHSVSAKVRSLALMAESLMLAGRRESAREALDAARGALAANPHLSPPELQTGRARLALAHARIAWDLASFPDAMRSIRSASALAETMLARNETIDIALAAEIYLTQGQFCVMYGLAGEASDALGRMQVLPAPPDSVRLDVEALLLDKLLASSFDISRSEIDGESHLLELQRAAGRARSARFYKVALTVGVALCNQYVLLDDFNASIDNVRKTLDLAKELGSSTFVATIVLDLADCAMMSGRVDLVREALDVVQTELPGSWNWIRLKLTQSWCDAKAHRYDAALCAAQEAERSARQSGNRRLHAAILRKLAIASHRLSRPGDAQDYIAEALDRAPYGSVWSHALTLQAAAKITGRPSFERDALEIQSFVLN